MILIGVYRGFFFGVNLMSERSELPIRPEKEPPVRSSPQRPEGYKNPTPL